jgi:hypothetical protein
LCQDEDDTKAELQQPLARYWFSLILNSRLQSIDLQMEQCPLEFANFEKKCSREATVLEKSPSLLVIPEVVDDKVDEKVDHKADDKADDKANDSKICQF